MTRREKLQKIGADAATAVAGRIGGSEVNVAVGDAWECGAWMRRSGMTITITIHVPDDADIDADDADRTRKG